MWEHNSTTAWKVPKYGVFSGPYLHVFGAEKKPCLDTFHAVHKNWNWHMKWERYEACGTLKAIERHDETQDAEHVRHEGTYGTRHVRHEDTQDMENVSHKSAFTRGMGTC